MDEAKLIINSENEIPLEGELITIGRTPDNTIQFADDSNISRYHAEIERREDGYWIIELGSSNGTTINGEDLETEKPLYDKDLIVFGGTSQIKVLFTPDEDDDETEEDEEKDTNSEDSDESQEEDSPKSENKSSKLPMLLVVTALACGLAVVFAATAMIFYFTRDGSVSRNGGGTTAISSCQASATIVAPEDGETLSEKTEIEIEIEDDDSCVNAVSFTLDGQEIAKSDIPPFTAHFNPDDFPQFEDGLSRHLKIVLFDSSGAKIKESPEVAIFAETTAVEDTNINKELDPNPQTDPNPKPTQTEEDKGRISIKDSVQMSNKVIKQFPGKFSYNFDKRFLLEVRKKTAEFVSEGYYERASKYADAINIEYIQEQNLPAPLGYTLAMSRSKFLPKNDSKQAGLWAMDNDFVVANAYNGLCGTETIAAPSQVCAAKASSTYLKSLFLNVFDGDIIYTVAAFGMSIQEAQAWKDSLPQNRKNFWRIIKSPKQREQVLKFFAATIVAENPQKFGLKNDLPLSELYAVEM